MAVRDILKMGDPRLLRVAQPVAHTVLPGSRTRQSASVAAWPQTRPEALEAFRGEPGCTPPRLP